MCLSFFPFQVSKQAYTDFAQALDAFFTLIATYLPEEDQSRIRLAYEFADDAHQGCVRRSGEPYIQHPVEVALLLAEMRIDAEGILAALLHDVVEDTDSTLDDICERFGVQVATLVDGVTKCNEVTPRGHQTHSGTTFLPTGSNKQHQRKEAIRKMLIAMMKDPRVAVLKIADRLHNMRTLRVMKPHQQQRTASEA